MVILDTNAILRYILQDNQTMADEVEQQLFDGVCFMHCLRGLTQRRQKPRKQANDNFK